MIFKCPKHDLQVSWAHVEAITLFFNATHAHASFIPLQAQTKTMSTVPNYDSKNRFSCLLQAKMTMWGCWLFFAAGTLWQWTAQLLRVQDSEAGRLQLHECQWWYWCVEAAWREEVWCPAESPVRLACASSLKLGVLQKAQWDWHVLHLWSLVSCRKPSDTCASSLKFGVLKKALSVKPFIPALIIISYIHGSVV